MAPSNPRPPAGSSSGPAAPGGKADWRAKGKPPVAGGGRSQPAGAGKWRQRGDTRRRFSERFRRVRLALITLLSVLLVAAFVWWVFLRYAATPLVALAVTEYGDLLPPNAWAEEDVTELDRLANDPNRQAFLRFNRQAVESRDGLESLVNLREAIRAKGGGPGRQTLIVYLSVHGAVDDKGNPCLLLPGPTPRDPPQRVALDEALRYLFSDPGRAKHKLLILDCNRMDANWRIGMLYNSFADGLDSALRTSGVQGLAILNSTSSGEELAWTSPERLRSSVFGYFVRAGLQGVADNKDVSEAGNGNRQVSLQELYKYVRGAAEQWALLNRCDRQRPKLVPEDANFPLVHVPPGETAALPEVRPLGEDRDRQNVISALWTEHARFRGQQAWRLDPLRWEAFEQALLRLEQLALAGDAYRRQFDSLSDDARRMVGKLGQDPLAVDLSAYSLPLSLRLRAPSDLDAQRARIAKQWDQPPESNEKTDKPDKPAADKPKAEPAKAEPAKADQPRSLPYTYLAAASEAWARGIANGDVSPAKLTPMVDSVEAASDRAQAGPGVIEIHFLRMMRDYLDPAVRSRYPDLTRTALRTRDLAEKAAAPTDERVLYALQKLCDEADENRRRAEDALFVGNEEAIRACRQRYEDTGGPGGSYVRAEKQAAELAGALRVRDRAWAETPYIAQWLTVRLRQDSPQQWDRHQADLRQLVLTTQDLAKELEISLAQGEASSDLTRKTKTASGLLDAMHQELQKEIDDESHRGDNRQTAQEIAVLLDTPLISGAPRNRLRERYLSILALEPSTEDSSRLGAAAESSATQPRHRNRLATGEHPLVAILRRDYLEEKGTRPPEARLLEDAKVPTPGGKPPEAAIGWLAEEGAAVRKKLSEFQFQAEENCKKTEENLDRTISPGSSRGGLSRADQLVRAYAAVLPASLTESAWPSHEDPTTRLRRFDLHHLLAWQAYRAMEDFWGPRDKPFFQAAAAGYLRSAKAVVPRAQRPRYAGQDLDERLNQLVGAARQGIVPDTLADPTDRATPSTALTRLVAEVPANMPAGDAALCIEDPAPGTASDAANAQPKWRQVPLADDEKAARSPWGRVRVAVEAGPRRPAAEQYWISNRDPSLTFSGSRAKSLEAVALYRGHKTEKPLVVTLLVADREVLLAAPNYPKPTITVHGEANLGCSLVFVLDCSGSMNELTPSGERRFIVARNTLIEVLLSLAKRAGHPYQVSVIAYSHRRGWKLNAAKTAYDVIQWNEDAIQNKTASRDRERDTIVVGPATPQNTPSLDWELIWGPQILTEASFREVKDRLNRLHPLGETPLYASIHEAVRLVRRASTREKRIIAITDGIDEQSADDQGRWTTTSWSDVADALRQNPGIALDVLGFDLTPALLTAEAKERARGDAAVERDLAAKFTKSYEDLTERLVSKGRFHNVRNAETLNAALKRSLQLRQFAIYRLGENSSDLARTNPAGPADLGATVVVEQSYSPTAPVRYRISLVEQSPAIETGVALQGGEGLELELKDTRLLHRHYEERLRKEEEVADPSRSSGRVVLGAHLPKRFEDGERMRFYFSTHSAEATEFSPRPEAAWVQIQPMSGNRPLGEPYIFSDLRFLKRKPSPVLICDAIRWPAAADTATARLWCRWNAAPAEKHAVAELRKKREIPLEIAQGVTVQFQEKPGEAGQAPRLILLEKHPRGGDLYTLKVELNPPPRKVAHRFYREVAMIRHEFEYDPSLADRVEGFEFRFTPRSKLVADAPTTKAPLVIDVPKTEEVSPANELDE